MLRAGRPGGRRRGRADRGGPVRDRRPVGRVRRDRDRRLRGRARGRPNAEPVRPLQRRDQVRGVPAARRRAGDRHGGDRALRADRAGRRRACGICDAARTRARIRRTCSTCWARNSCRDRCSRSAGCRRRRRAHIAERFGLPVASKPDSQELCFAPSGDAGAFVRSAAPQLVHAGRGRRRRRQRVLATHDGTFAFTVGQRRGLGVATGARNYVVDVDAAANRVVVGPQALLSRSGLVADRVSWVAGSASRRRSVRGVGAHPLPGRRRRRR